MGIVVNKGKWHIFHVSLPHIQQLYQFTSLYLENLNINTYINKVKRFTDMQYAHIA